MSADLFAEFGRGSAAAQDTAGRPQTTRSQADSLIPGLDQSDEIFFAGASASSQDRPQVSHPRAPANHYTAPAPAPRQPFGFQTFSLPQHQDSDVLFDAAIDTPASEEEDDWGEFEGPEATAQQDQPKSSEAVLQEVTAPAPKAQHLQTPRATGTIDLLDSLSLEDPAPATSHRPNPSHQGKHLQQASNPLPEPAWDDDSFDDWGDFTDRPSTKSSPPMSPQKKAQQSIKPTPPQPTRDDDSFDDWGDFTDGPSTTRAPPKPKANPRPTSPQITSTPAPHSFISPTPASPPSVRPTNIPPPSVLLELLVGLFNNLQKEASTAKRESPPNPSTASKLHNTLSTAARIIAGRTHRWKRDTILSQSMRIGPARSGKPGGMKLSAVNKHEDVKEEQDAVDVLTLWRERAALFNAVIQAAGLKPIPPIPDLSALKVITARADQGALKAGHSCALCALKRDERLLKVDEEVQDSFGEWWTEHWGHTGCRRFWEGNRGLLGQR